MNEIRRERARSMDVHITLLGGFVLARGVKRYTLTHKSLEGMELALASREKVKGNLEKQLDAMRNQKAELTAANVAGEPAPLSPRWGQQLSPVVCQPTPL